MKHPWMKKAATLFTLLTLTFSAAACGNGGAAATGASEQAAGDTADTSKKSEDTATKTPTKDVIEGDWIMAFYTDHVEYEDGESYDYVIMCSDPYASEAEIRITRDGADYKADYRYENEYYSQRLYGNTLEYRDVPAYEGCGNDQWSYAFEKKFDEDEDITIALTDADTLVMHEVTEGGDDEFHYKDETVSTYLRKGSAKLDNIDDLRYFDTVTVSDVKGLLENIKNNTKIILKEGTYDLSSVDGSAFKSEFVDYEYGQLRFEGVSNLCIEAQEGAEVLISVADAYAPVLSFIEGGSNITLRGLTVGHDVEPGYCSGSVTYFDGVGGINIEDCNLFGSGTYGVEANYCSNINVSGCDIYECTYGLVSITNSDTIRFHNCEMRDSKDLNMFDLAESYSILFEDCRIHNNDSSEAYEGLFINSEEYADVTFKNCEFTENVYQRFSRSSVTLDQCTVNDIVKEPQQEEAQQ